MSSKSNILLIITSSYDVTTDLLLRHLPDECTFRFNSDLWEQYELVFDKSGFVLSDPTGRTVSSNSIYKAYWRKPEWPSRSNKLDEQQRYAEEEFKCVLDDVVNLLWSNSKFVLVEPRAERRVGKLIQLSKAEQFFNVPRFRVQLNVESRSTKNLEVVKSLSGGRFGNRFIFSTRVNPATLAGGYPWFVQEYVQAPFDVTIVVVRTRVFAFKLARNFLEESIDCREVSRNEYAWSRTELLPQTAENVLRYMSQLRLHFGRLDFLEMEDGILQFCEINPNGQYAWLDAGNQEGVLAAIVEEISPLTERHSIPVKHPLDDTDP